MQLNDLLRLHVGQILNVARRCRYPDVRTELEELARACLADLDAAERAPNSAKLPAHRPH